MIVRHGTLQQPRRLDVRATAIAAIIALSVFVVDAYAPLEIAIAVLYVVVVMLAISTGRRWTTIAAGWSCAGFATMTFLLQYSDQCPEAAIARYAVSLAAIATTSMLALRHQISSARLREQVRLLDLTHDAIVVYDMNDLVMFWNQGAEEVYGWTAEDVLGKSVHALLHTRCTESKSMIREALFHEGQWSGEIERIRRDGTVIAISSRLALWRDTYGKPCAVLATNNDITDRKRIARELQRQKDELRAAIDAIPGMVWSSSGDGRLAFINRRWHDLGVSSDFSSDSDDWRAVIHPDDLASMEQCWRHAVANGLPFELIARMRYGDGEYRWMHIGAEPLLDADGRVTRWYGVNTDIEARKRAEQGLARSEAFLADAQRLSKTGSIAIQPGDNSVPGEMTWSDEAYRILGYSHAVTPSLDLMVARTHPDDVIRVRGELELLLAGLPQIDVEYRLAFTDDCIRYVRFVAHIACLSTGRAEYVGALMDMTEAKQMQEALARSVADLAHVTRVTTLGELAASIAHEITQPISAVVTGGETALSWLNRSQPNFDEVGESIRQMMRDARRANGVIHQIRAMARKGEAERNVIDLNSMINESLELVTHELRIHGVTLELALAHPAPQVNGDRVQLQQVLINLLMNAVQAMNEVEGCPKIIRVLTRRVDEGHTQVFVQDTGPGFNEKSQRQLFTPFFTTKSNGVGIGLSICRSIIEAHGGRIRAESLGGLGAIFHFVLPLSVENT